MRSVIYVWQYIRSRHYCFHETKRYVKKLTTSFTKLSCFFIMKLRTSFNKISCLRNMKVTASFTKKICFHFMKLRITFTYSCSMKHKKKQNLSILLVVIIVLENTSESCLLCVWICVFKFISISIVLFILEEHGN